MSTTFLARIAAALALFSLPAVLSAAALSPQFSAAAPIVTADGGTLAVLLPVTNTGAAAGNVTVTGVTLGGEEPSSSAPLPISAGDLGPGASVSLDVAFDASAFAAGGSYLMTVRGTYFAGTTYGFTVSRWVKLPPPPVPTIVQPNVTMLPSDRSVTVSGEDAGSVTLTGAVPPLAPGQVIVSGAGTGLLRKVVSISTGGGATVVQTQPATLEDVFVQADIRVGKVLGPDDFGGNIPMLAGVTVGAGGANAPRGLLDPHGLTATFPISLANVHFPTPGSPAELTGAGSLSLAFDLTISIRFGQLKTVQWVPTITSDLNATLTCGADQDFPDTTVTLAPPLQGKSFAVDVGGIPVVLTPSLELDAHMGGNVKAGVSLTSDISVTSGAGVEYDAGSGWHAVTQYAQNVQLLPVLDEYASATFEFTPLKPVLNLMVYGVAGPYVTADLPKLNAAIAGSLTPPSADVDVTGDVDASAGFHVQIFKLSVDYATPPLDYHFPIYNKVLYSVPKPAYSITDLGANEDFGNFSFINNSGQVVVGDTLYSNGKAILYGGSNVGVVPEGINDLGQVVGSFTLSSSGKGGGTQAFLYSGGVFQELSWIGMEPGKPFGTSTFTFADGINNKGQIVETSTVGVDKFDNDISNVFLRQGGSVTDLTSLGDADATGINNNGEVTGGFLTPGNYYHAFLWQPGKTQDLGTLPGDDHSYAHGLNDAGQVVGESQNLINNTYAPVGGTHAFLWKNGQMQGLGTLPGTTDCSATGINGAGHVVGTCYDANGYNTDDAFIWQNGQMQNLNDLIPAGTGWMLTGYTSCGINDKGQICGVGMLNGKQHAFLLTPLPGTN